MKQKPKSLRTAIYLLCAMFLLNSCNSGEDNSQNTATDSTVPTATTADTTSSAQAAPQKLTDPEIASVAVTADQIDIDYAGIAKEKSKNAKVYNLQQPWLRIIKV